MFYLKGGDRMLGDEMGNKAISVTINATQITAKLVLEVMKAIAKDKYKVVNGKQSLKDLNKKGKALENVNIDKADLKAIQRQLKKDGIDFAIKNKIKSLQQNMREIKCETLRGRKEKIVREIKRSSYFHTYSFNICKKKHKVETL